MVSLWGRFQAGVLWSHFTFCFDSGELSATLLHAGPWGIGVRRMGQCALGLSLSLSLGEPGVSPKKEKIVSMWLFHARCGWP